MDDIRRVREEMEAANQNYLRAEMERRVEMAQPQIVTIRAGATLEQAYETLRENGMNGAEAARRATAIFEDAPTVPRTEPNGLNRTVLANDWNIAMPTRAQRV